MFGFSRAPVWNGAGENRAGDADLGGIDALFSGELKQLPFIRGDMLQHAGEKARRGRRLAQARRIETFHSRQTVSTSLRCRTGLRVFGG